MVVHDDDQRHQFSPKLAAYRSNTDYLATFFLFRDDIYCFVDALQPELLPFLSGTFTSGRTRQNLLVLDLARQFMRSASEGVQLYDPELSATSDKLQGRKLEFADEIRAPLQGSHIQAEQFSRGRVQASAGNLGSISERYDDRAGMPTSQAARFVPPMPIETSTQAALLAPLEVPAGVAANAGRRPSLFRRLDGPKTDAC